MTRAITFTLLAVLVAGCGSGGGPTAGSIACANVPGDAGGFFTQLCVEETGPAPLSCPSSSPSVTYVQVASCPTEMRVGRCEVHVEVPSGSLVLIEYGYAPTPVSALQMACDALMGTFTAL